MTDSEREEYIQKLRSIGKDFSDYVDRYTKNYNEGRSITLEEALKHQQVMEYAVWLVKNTIGFM